LIKNQLQFFLLSSILQPPDRQQGGSFTPGVFLFCFVFVLSPSAERKRHWIVTE